MSEQITNMSSKELASLFEEFGREVYHKVTGHVGAGEADEWCDDLMGIATKLGLANREIYNPEKHGSLGGHLEPGFDFLWWWGFLPDGWRPSQAAQ